jgi:hypothetical protein
MEAGTICVRLHPRSAILDAVPIWAAIGFHINHTMTMRCCGARIAADIERANYN